MTTVSQPINRISSVLHSTESLDRQPFLPYGKQQITDEDIVAVTTALRSDWLTQGPTIERFEAALCGVTGSRNAIVCSNATAALHLCLMALEIGPGDTILTTPVTFLADANCARYVGADVAFADIDPRTANLDLDAVDARLSADSEKKIKAVIAVHLAGEPIDLPKLRAITNRHGVFLIDDCCHAIGGSYPENGTQLPIGNGSHSDLSVFSFHPVKHVATGEGGAITTRSRSLADKLRRLRSHGMEREAFVFPEMAYAPDGNVNPWYYEMSEFGYNYRMTDLQAALGISQLSRIAWSVERRREIAGQYRTALAGRISSDLVAAVADEQSKGHAYHLFVVRIKFKELGLSRAIVMNRLKEAKIGTQVHYIPIHLQPYYRALYQSAPGDFPAAEHYYEEALSLPMYPTLTPADIQRVVEQLARAMGV